MHCTQSLAPLATTSPRSPRTWQQEVLGGDDGDPVPLLQPPQLRSQRGVHAVQGEWRPLPCHVAPAALPAAWRSAAACAQQQEGCCGACMLVLG